MSERNGSDSEFEPSADLESTKKLIIQFQSRCMPDSPLSDIAFKNEMVEGLDIQDWLP